MISKRAFIILTISIVALGLVSIFLIQYSKEQAFKLSYKESALNNNPCKNICTSCTSECPNQSMCASIGGSDYYSLQCGGGCNCINECDVEKCTKQVSEEFEVVYAACQDGCDNEDDEKGCLNQCLKGEFNKHDWARSPFYIIVKEQKLQ